MTFPRVALLVAALLGCDPASDARSSSAGGAPAPGAAPPGAPAPLQPYPAGPWRQAGAALSRVVLWPSHILVRYAGVENPTDVSFTMADFHSVLPAPTRTRDEALALARELQRQAQAEPQHFAELARRHSEDIVRRELGGSFGGLPAGQLKPWPEVLDALFAIAPGQISDVVETAYGFHVFTRRPPPAPETVTGRRIVIGHTDARWLGRLEATAPTRSREEARQLAERVYEQARERPDLFSALVAEHSELRDRAVGGDFGTWSSVEVCVFPREVEVLAGLEIGGVSPPFDSLFGWQIVQRVPDRARREYALDGIAVPFDPRAAESAPGSSGRALARARELASRLREAPSLLPQLAREDGVAPASGQWTEGRGSPELMAALAAVPVGQLIGEPVRSATRYILGRRVEPRPAHIEPALFELPAASLRN
jgi:hypothetical protein